MHVVDDDSDEETGPNDVVVKPLRQVVLCCLQTAAVLSKSRRIDCNKDPTERKQRNKLRRNEHVIDLSGYFGQTICR